MIWVLRNVSSYCVSHCHQSFEPLDAADEIVRDTPVYLVSSQSATWLLGPGQHNIRHVFYMSP